ncbi:chemotaxis protein CheW [Phormidium sp. CCY1219]|uniref:chemotaxis protein CheW n=1 Tax=Phormidium sp. CCY1219 TaxID=2886104 RepID=UPI002D1E7943|nr:chemotaxis protein CheW [Phormidium sp. CCY1219]MEB3828227.1 chemotaxis protein CheW [Phormidium sp. CCY1219]
MVGNPDFLTGVGLEQAPEFQELESPEGELHLRFYVPSGNEFALGATGIREVISHSPERITPIPNVSSLLLGTLNIRGRVIWVADLGQFLGDPTPLNTDRAEIPVIAVEDQETILGLAVDKIVGMDWLDVEQVRLPTNVPDSMAPFLRGEWVLPDKKEQSDKKEQQKEHDEQDKQNQQNQQKEQKERILRLLDQVAIVRSARWAA